MAIVKRKFNLRKRRQRFGSGKEDRYVLISSESNLNNVLTHEFNESWSARLGAWAQIGMLIVLLFGYFFTVRPIFQYQLLQEQTAKLELEKSNSERQLEVLEMKQAKIESEIVVLKRNYEHEKTESKKLVDQMQILRASEAKARDRIIETEGKLTRELEALELARWELLFVDFSIQSSSIRFGRFFDKDYKEPTLEEYLFTEMEQWPRPYNSLIEAVIRLGKINEKYSKYPNDYIDELREFIEKRKLNLHCEVPNLVPMIERYRKDMVTLDKEVEKELAELMDGAFDEYEKKNKYTKKSLDAYRKGMRREIRLIKKHDVNSRYYNEVAELKKSCEILAHETIRDFKKIKGVAIIEDWWKYGVFKSAQ